MPEEARERGATHVPANEGRSYWLATDLHTFKVVGEDTGGAYALSELTAHPGFEPPPHIHRREDEAYYVLEGEFEFVDDGRAFTAGPGALVYLPRGRLHMHGAAADAPAKALVLVAPAGVEGFIEEAGMAAGDPSSVPSPPAMPELQRIVETAQKYGIEVPPPPDQQA
jgi:quercetin dioxygenase-like cupin family protein